MTRARPVVQRGLAPSATLPQPEEGLIPVAYAGNLANKLAAAETDDRVSSGFLPVATARALAEPYATTGCQSLSRGTYNRTKIEASSAAQDGIQPHRLQAIVRSAVSVGHERLAHQLRQRRLAMVSVPSVDAGSRDSSPRILIAPSRSPRR